MRQTLGRLALTACALLLWSTAEAQERPEAVTPEAVSQGEGLFKGAGLCSACHGASAKGIPNLGANLTDDEWLHSDGSFDGILKSITEGISADKSSSGTVMPPKGGSALSDSQLKAVAAYVWSLSNK
ncbi:MAG: c-type cytochrome [Gemmatimonadota bacterium]|nr:MAG: c-type cytochrome [Gemmatimonadota bacterium]